MVTSIEGSGRIREPGEIFRKQLLDAESLDDSGYVLKAEVESTIDKVSLCDSGEFPLCVNMRSTRDPFDLNHPSTIELTGSSDRLASIDVSDDGEHALKVAANNAAIAVGDPVVVAAAGGGKIDKYTPTVVGDTSAGDESANIIARFTELGTIVGYATEVCAVGGGGNPGKDKCRVRLTIKQVPVIA
jgi:hypothetical protein